jgi:hypothetical protein
LTAKITNSNIVLHNSKCKNNYIFAPSMNQQVKKYLSLFLIVLFLFPQVEKAVHDIQHSKDSHCASANKHFHSLEHSCSICDFTSSNSSSTPDTDYQFILCVQRFSFEPFIESNIIQNAFNNLPARAPPIA